MLDRGVKMPRKPFRDPNTGDLFDIAEVFPAAKQRTLPLALDFNRMLSGIISKALRETPISRAEIAARMSEMLGDDVSVNMLNAYASPGRADHNMSLIRFIAFTRATQQPWLWSAVLKDEGITILVGEEQRLAQLGLAQAKRREAEDKKRELDLEIKRLQGLAPTGLVHRGGKA